MSWSVFGNRTAHERVEPPLAAPQAQEDINEQTQGLLTDKEKWQRSKQRWNPDIKPADEAFSITYNYFLEELKTKSPEAVVNKDFSNHEVRKFLSGYVDKKRFKAIGVLQTSDKDRYIGLLQTDDYKDVKAHSSPLALKLTMMYFGLPVAPMAFTDPLQASGESPFTNLVFSSGLNEVEDEFDDEDLSFVPEQLRPLRFLNYYDRRGHGKDNAHMNPEKTYELFYGIPMVVPTHELMTRTRLRGAGVQDASDDLDFATDDSSDEMLTMVTPSSPESTNTNRLSPHIALHDGERDANAGEQVYLWGLSGRTVFSYFDPKSFFSAIDRILGLRKRSDGDTYVGITISLLSHPKGERGPCRVLASDQCFLGRCKEDELNFHRTWLDTVQYFDDQIKDGDALDICVVRISEDIHFSEMQDKLAYRPSLNEGKVVAFSLSDDSNGALSYLSMSRDVDRYTTAVQYQAWFRSLWRTLSHPPEEQLRTYSIGSNEVLPPQSCLVRITCADASEDETPHWFLSDVGPTREAWEYFIEAYYVKGCKEFILNAIPMTDPRASSITVHAATASVATDAEQMVQEVQERDREFYWGCHSHIDDAIAFQETDQPQAQAAAARPPQLNSLGRPANGVQLSDFAKGKAFREWSYAHPLSIHMQGQYPSIPINAPPLETILKTPGINGGPSDSVPVMSTQVLTPSEQRHLQETVFEMRSLALNRAQPCPFRPCSKHFAIDDAGRQLFRDHIQNTHIDKKCPLCDDKMFGYYDAQTKQQHFYEKHVYYFSHKDDLHLNTVFEVDSLHLTDKREAKWNFCARCGRDHNKLNVNGDRAQHDNICFPGVTEEEARRRYCVDCGGNTNGATRHSHKHLDECSYKPPTGEGPINTVTGEPNESPNDGRLTRYWEKQRRFTRNDTPNIVQVPKGCYVKGCTKTNLQELHADALFSHYGTETHINATDRLRFCPICNLDFVAREWTDKKQKVDHFKDHVEEREKRIKLDLEIAKATNKLDAVVLDKINLRNEDEFVLSTTREASHQAEAQVVSSKLEKDIERLLEDQKRATQESQARFDSLETSFKNLMDAFVQDRTAKRSREPTSTPNLSGTGSSKRQRTSKAFDIVEAHTPQGHSPDQESWDTTPSTGSSGAIMTPSDGTSPAGARGSEPPSSTSSRTLGPLTSPLAPTSAPSMARTRERNLPLDPDTSQQQVTAPIRHASKSKSSKTTVQSGGSRRRTSARRAQVVRTEQANQVIADEDDNDVQEVEEQ
ncbi:hypothetical protein N0V93_002980 [Gnomoniopsis smithogilvyi]|uniref:Uncharacterized protein n=1 Tax=Gnomoniopsis smithogilvyi TaxID=1191159 RepID=A0A9W8YVT4_9PEZI|nr:hypothetical protein N0V93_002980 [Gnomoniopsis smithogilvyi]